MTKMSRFISVLSQFYCNCAASVRGSNRGFCRGRWHAKLEPSSVAYEINSRAVERRRAHLSVNVDDGAEQSPRAALSVDVQHAQNLQEPNSAVDTNADAHNVWVEILFTALVGKKERKKI